MNPATGPGRRPAAARPAAAPRPGRRPAARGRRRPGRCRRRA
ncbi:MAG: class F sortase, partial [Planctomycetes bacterium]|nr:class F sortase [Planctomycetota bacterium]